MSMADTVENVISTIISAIRNSTLESIARSEGDHDPWDEAENGAGWCDNEISLFMDLFEIAYPETEHSLNVENCHSVSQVQETLRSCDVSVLMMLREFILRGGTGYEQHFSLRESDDTGAIAAMLSS